jgi:hypothetical protein
MQYAINRIDVPHDRGESAEMILDTQVVALKRLDIYRDGGSVSVSFVGANGFQYCLFFGIGRQATPDLAAGYRSPLLKWFRVFEYRSPITGDVSPGSEPDSHTIEWSEARRILDDLAPFAAGFKSDHHWVFKEMVEAAAQHGR